jgi:hypothetical protein
MSISHAKALTYLQVPYLKEEESTECGIPIFPVNDNCSQNITGIFKFNDKYMLQ